MNITLSKQDKVENKGISERNTVIKKNSSKGGIKLESLEQQERH
jgi:DNA-binding Xre family transcriptional regulator